MVWCATSSVWRAADPHSSRTCALAAVLHPRHIVGVCKGTILSRRLTVHDKARQKGRLVCVTMVATQGLLLDTSPTHLWAAQRAGHAAQRTRALAHKSGHSQPTSSRPSMLPRVRFAQEQSVGQRVRSRNETGRSLQLPQNASAAKQQRPARARCLLQTAQPAYALRRVLRFGSGPLPSAQPTRHPPVVALQTRRKSREQQLQAVVKICPWRQARCCQTSKQGPGLQLNKRNPASALPDSTARTPQTSGDVCSAECVFGEHAFRLYRDAATMTA